MLADFYARHSQLIDQIGINALLALSLSVSLQAGQLALAQAAFMGIAAYVTAILTLTYHWPLIATILVAVLVAMLAGAALAYPVRRLRGVFLAIATIGFGEIVRVVANNLSITGGAEGMSGLPQDANTLTIYTALALVALALFGLSRTKFALAVALVSTPRGAWASTSARSVCSRSRSAARLPDSRARSTRTRRRSSRPMISGSNGWSRSSSGA